MNMFAWINPQGEWLTYSERTTHTGTHRVLNATTNLDDAYVGPAIPKYNVPNSVNTTELIAIRATVKTVRTVTLVRI